MDTIQDSHASGELGVRAVRCKHCNSILTDVVVTPLQQGQQQPSHLSSLQSDHGTLWLPVPSLILGIISILAFFDDSYWDLDTIMGLVLFSGTGLLLGILGSTLQVKGRGMSITGIVLCSIALIGSIGLLAGL